MIKIIVAMDQHCLIGNKAGNMGMPWHNIEDLQHFKATTLHQTILMGRITYEVIGKPLPKRKTIVVTSSDLTDENVVICHDLKRLLNKYQNQEETLYICGGASIYQQTIDYADELIISLIPGEYLGDSYFPRINEHQFECVATVEKKTFVLKRYRRK